MDNQVREILKLKSQEIQNLYDILIKSIGKMAEFLDEKYGTHSHDVFYKMILDFAIYVVARCDKSEKENAFRKIKEDKLVCECLEKFKPKSKKDKFKMFLLKNNMLGIARLVSKIKN